jgi:hypothetical protein
VPEGYPQTSANCSTLLLKVRVNPSLQTLDPAQALVDAHVLEQFEPTVPPHLQPPLTSRRQYEQPAQAVEQSMHTPLPQTWLSGQEVAHVTPPVPQARLLLT